MQSFTVVHETFKHGTIKEAIGKTEPNKCMDFHFEFIMELEEYCLINSYLSDIKLL